MKKVLLIFSMITCAVGAYAHTSDRFGYLTSSESNLNMDPMYGTVFEPIADDASELSLANSCGGRFFNGTLKRSVTKKDILDFLYAPNGSEYSTFIDSDGSRKNLMASGITRAFWIQCFGRNFNATAGKDLNESVSANPGDPESKINGGKVIAVIEASVEVQRTWNAVLNPNPGNGGSKYLSSEVLSTYPCLEQNTFMPWPRAAYDGESQLEYKSKLILSEICGNPLQDNRTNNELYDEEEFGTMPDYVVKTSPTGTTNIYISNKLNNSGGNSTIYPTMSAPVEVVEKTIIQEKTPTLIPYTAPGSTQIATLPYTAPTQQIVQNQPCNNCPMSEHEKRMEKYAKRTARATEATAVGAWVAPFGATAFGFGLNKAFPNDVSSTTNNYYTQGGNGGFVPNPSGPLPGTTTTPIGGMVTNGTGDVNNPYITTTGGFAGNFGN